MAFTLEMTPELEAVLKEEAERLGLTPEDLAMRLTENCKPRLKRWAKETSPSNKFPPFP